MDYGYQPFDGNQFQGGFPGIDVVQDVIPAAVEEEAAPAPVEETPTPSGELSNGRLYVGNLSWNVAWQDLKDYFKSCGHVVRADVMTGSDGRSRGCGLVEFATADEAATAISTLNDTELKGRPIFVREDRESHPREGRQPRPPREDKVRSRPVTDNKGIASVYCGNLPWDVSWQQLKDHFRDSGFEVRRAEVMETNNGRSKGYGIIKFDSPEVANDAVVKMNGTEIGGRAISVRLDREA